MDTQMTRTKEEIIPAFDEAIKQLIIVLTVFNEDDFNKVPFEGSWTAGQVAEHLYKSVSRIPALLVTESREAGRDAFEKCGEINAVFLNFEVKFKSPSFILPSDDRKQVSFFTSGFRKVAEDINALAGEKDLAKLYPAFPFPQLGPLTGYEWICFGVAHSIRHTRQLKNILEHMKS